MKRQLDVRKKGEEKDLENRKVVYTIYKNKVWREVMYKGVSLALRAVFTGKSKKECENWIKENTEC